MTVCYQWRGEFDNTEVDSLHAEGFDHSRSQGDWWEQVNRHSLGWVCARARQDSALVGFVNVAWDGAAHAFILDTVVAADAQRQGIGVQLIAVAGEHARAAGCGWLHVDFGADLSGFYLDACGFTSTHAGLIAL
ncbi:MAG: GNAT family N-acetyltransferase [Natronosporangium sp.]